MLQTVQVSLLRASVLFLTLISAIPAFSQVPQEDLEGSRDFDGLPRVAGTIIAGYQFSTYDAGSFVTGIALRKPVLVHPEGQRTRVIYLGREDQTALQMLRNYTTAFADFGDYTERYACRADECYT